jgi:hypothetical protein
LKRKTFGVMDGLSSAPGSLLGNTLNTAGNVMTSTPASVVGGLAGGSVLGATITTALKTIGGAGSLLASASNPLGWVLGAGLGAAAMKGIGRGLKEIGTEMKY